MAHLNGEIAFLSRIDIGRVGHQKVDTTAVIRRDRLVPGAPVQLNVKTQPLRVLRRQLQRRRRAVSEQGMGDRHLAGQLDAQAQPDRTAPRPEIDEHQTISTRSRLSPRGKRLLDDVLGLWSRDQRTRVDEELDLSERPEPEQILQRLARRSTTSHLPGRVRFLNLRKDPGGLTRRSDQFRQLVAKDLLSHHPR